MSTHTKLYMHVHSSIIRNYQKWKQPKCLSTDEQIRTNKMWYVRAGEYDSALKRNEILIHAITCMNLENTTLSERS